MKLTEAAIDIPTGDKTAIRIRRFENSVTVRHVGPDRADNTTPVSFGWSEFCQIPVVIDQLRILFGEKTSMDK